MAASRPVYKYVKALVERIFRVTTCLENREMSGNLTAVREMSGILLKVREVSGTSLVNDTSTEMI